MIWQFNGDGSGIVMPPETARGLVPRVGSAGSGRGWPVQVERPLPARTYDLDGPGSPTRYAAKTRSTTNPDLHGGAGDPQGRHLPGPLTTDIRGWHARSG